MGSVAAQLFSGFSRDVRKGSSPGSGWATQGQSETWQTPSRLSCAFYWRVAAEVVVLLGVFPISTEELWSSVRMTIRFLVTYRTKALLPRLLSLARRPALGRVLVVPNIFHLRMMEATVFLVTFKAAEMFWYTSPRSVPRHNPVSALYGQLVWPHGLVFALTCTWAQFWVS